MVSSCNHRSPANGSAGSRVSPEETGQLGSDDNTTLEGGTGSYHLGMDHQRSLGVVAVSFIGGRSKACPGAKAVNGNAGDEMLSSRT